MAQPPAIDLWRDIVSGCEADLTQRGHSVADLDDWHCVRTFLNAERRRFPARPRQVYKSRQFTCPSAHSQALADIEGKIQAGEDLAPYLSRRTGNPRDSDALLNHWGIFHLHLGTTMEDDGFVARTNHLLFCKFTHQGAYLIDVHPHQDAWPRTEMMRIIHDNWPETIAHWRARGVTGDSLSDSKVAKLRASNLNHVLKMPDGVVYFAPGGGTTSAGSNPVDTLVVDCLKDWSARESQRIIDDWSHIRDRVRAEEVDFVEPVNFVLWYDGAEYRALEAVQRFSIDLLQPDLHCPAVTREQIARISGNHV